MEYIYPEDIPNYTLDELRQLGVFCSGDFCWRVAEDRLGWHISRGMHENSLVCYRKYAVRAGVDSDLINDLVAAASTRESVALGDLEAILYREDACVAAEDVPRLLLVISQHVLQQRGDTPTLANRIARHTREVEESDDRQSR